MKYDKEKIKELILTDYLDGQLDETSKREVESAIEKDPELKDFLIAVQKTTNEPFLRIEDADPPEQIWNNIREEISTPDIVEPSMVLADFWQYLKNLGARPRLSFAMGTIMTVLIVFMWVGVGRMRVIKAPYNSEEQIGYLVELASGELMEDDDFNGGFETAIEEYFL